MDHEGSLNFWPAVADFMLALVLILIMAIAAIGGLLVDVEWVQNAQTRVANHESYTREGLTRCGPPQADATLVRWCLAGEPAIEFRTDLENPFLQRIVFRDSVLFDTDKFDLKERGRLVLAQVGRGILKEIGSIDQVQVHGHADVRPTPTYRDNLELASLRANEVFRFLTRPSDQWPGIDPVSQVRVSATSFGEFVPVAREPQESRTAAYNAADLCRDNDTGPGCLIGARLADTDAMRRNRRVEILLFFKNEGARR